MLFKLAFHTYEAINYKGRIKKRISEGIESEQDFELMSNRSDETVMTTTTTTGPDASQKKFQKIEENLNIKLNNYIMKW